MELRIKARPGELSQKAPELLRRLAEVLLPSPEAETVLGVLHKAKGSALEQRALRSPVLRHIHAEMEQLYEEQLTKMVAEVCAVVDRNSVRGDARDAPS